MFQGWRRTLQTSVGGFDSFTPRHPMNWQQAVNESPIGRAWRRDSQGRTTMIDADGRAIRTLLGNPDEVEEVGLSDVAGYLDWEPEQNT